MMDANKDLMDAGRQYVTDHIGEIGKLGSKRGGPSIEAYLQGAARDMAENPDDAEWIYEGMRLEMNSFTEELFPPPGHKLPVKS